MPLTRNFKDTVMARAERDPEFRPGLFCEAINALLRGDLDTGKALLRDYVNATVGFEALAAELGKSPKNLMRKLSGKGNPHVANLFAMIGNLKQREGSTFEIIHSKRHQA